MATDPLYVPDSWTDEDYAAQLAAIDAGIAGLGAPAPMPLDTVLTPPSGSNNRSPSPPPPPEPAPAPAPTPAPQQVGFVPVPAAGAAVGEESAAPVAEPSTGEPSWATPPGPGAGILPEPPTGTFDPAALQFRIGQDVVDRGGAAALADPFTAAMNRQAGERESDRREQIGLTAQYLGMSPEDLAIVDAKRQIAAEDEAATKMMAAAKADRERAEANEREFRAARDRVAERAGQTAVEASALANARVENRGWWHDKSTGQVIAGVLGAIAGAVYQTRNGGPNVALQAMDAAVERDLQAQRENLAHRRQVLGERTADDANALQQAEGNYRAEEVFRAAAYERIGNQILTEAQQYDPNGSTASRLVHTYRDVMQRRDRALQDAYDNDLKRETARVELAGKLIDNATKEKKLAGIGAGGASFEKRVWTPDQLAAISPGQPVPPIPMSGKDYRSWLLAQKTGNEVQATARADGVSDEDRKRLVGDLKQPDGSWFRANGSEGDITKLKDRYQAANTAVRSIDNILALRTGWTSDTVKGPEWQRIQAEYANAIGAAKDAMALGALSGPDMDLVRQQLGNVDPTGVRDPSAGLRQARELITNMVRDNLKGAGYLEPGRYSIPNLADLKPRTVTPEEQGLTGMLEWQTNAYAFGKSPDVITSYSGEHTTESIRADQRGYSDAQKRYAENLAKTAGDDEAPRAKRDAARASLEQIEKRALSPGYRELARGLAAEKTFDITSPPAPYDPNYQAFKDWYLKTYDRPFLDDRDFPAVRPVEAP